MSIIIEFNKKEKNQLIRKWKKAEKIGEGNEGKCYLIDGYAYKIIDPNMITYYDESIYTEISNLKSFLFPEEVYMHGDIVFASKTKYIKNEMSEKTISEGLLPNIDKIKKALVPFIRDVYILSKNNILAIDLKWKNILFDGKNFYAIDTLHYAKNEEYFQIDAYKLNFSYVKQNAISFIQEYKKSCIKHNIPLSNKQIKELDDLLPYIDKVTKQVQEEYKDKEVQKIKRP